MDYKIISSIDKGSFERDITDMLNAGYSLHGDMFMNVTTHPIQSHLVVDQYNQVVIAKDKAND